MVGSEGRGKGHRSTNGENLSIPIDRFCSIHPKQSFQLCCMIKASSVYSSEVVSKLYILLKIQESSIQRGEGIG